jgi:hypothetical protein
MRSHLVLVERKSGAIFWIKIGFSTKLAKKFCSHIFGQIFFLLYTSDVIKLETNIYMAAQTRNAITAEKWEKKMAENM